MTNFFLGSTSEIKLSTCHPLIIDWIHYAIKRTPFDFTVIWGHRTKEEQEDCVSRGTSTLHFPKSNHNILPSGAIDVAPYPINWNDINSFMELGFFLMNCARELEIPMRWGAFFTKRIRGQVVSTPDWGHFELRE